MSFCLPVKAKHIPFLPCLEAMWAHESFRVSFVPKSCKYCASQSTVIKTEKSPGNKAFTLSSHLVWPKNTVNPAKQEEIVYGIACEWSKGFMDETGLFRRGSKSMTGLYNSLKPIPLWFLSMQGTPSYLPGCNCSYWWVTKVVTNLTK